MPVKIKHFLTLPLILCGLFQSNTGFAQAVLIHEGPANQTGICEPTISVDPTNTQNVYAASVLNNFYQSTDGGLSWTKESITSPYGVWGDPCLVTDFKGRTYFFHLSDPEGTNWRSDQILDRMVCQTKDGPEDAFNDGSYTAVNGKKHDKEWTAVNPKNGAIALSWTQFDQYGTDDPECHSRILFSESLDQGAHWSTPE
ncbi:MAG: exo-alpha-sialidase, partial [Flavobacteriales bacterium]|nr:exo-alpha-sialidase [Flavobacteriales bacterium]